MAHCCSRSYMAAQGSKASASYRRQMCLLPPSRASNNILKGKIYRPSLLPFLFLSLSLSLYFSFSLSPTSAFYFLFPHLSHRNLYNFYRILLSASAWYRLLCFAHAAQRCTAVQFLSLGIPPPRHHFTNYPSLYSLLYLSKMIFDPSQGSWNWRGKLMRQSKARCIVPLYW